MSEDTTNVLIISIFEH